MSVQLCIYEDEKASHFLPLSWTHPVYDLKCGMMTLGGRILRSYPGTRVCLVCRDHLESTMRGQYPGVAINAISADSALFVNGRVLATSGLASQIPLEGEDAVYLSGEEVVAVRLSGKGLENLKTNLARPLGRGDFGTGREESVAVDLIGYLWDLVARNGEQIGRDYQKGGRAGKVEGRVYEGVHLLNPSLITVAKGAVVKPGVVVDAEGGAVFIDEGAEVLPNAVIQGPAYVGKKSVIKVGAKLTGGTSVGELCKVGGEVEGSIIHAYSNKQHDGFLGHSYIGAWVNLGAGTNNSDLKNNYGSVKVFVDGAFVDSGHLFVGLMMGDHSKTGINTMFNTGTFVGVCCNLFGTGFPPKFVPSFSWGGEKGFSEYELSKGLETARKVMARRQVEMDEGYEQMLRMVFNKTAGYREQFLTQG